MKIPRFRFSLRLALIFDIYLIDEGMRAPQMLNSNRKRAKILARASWQNDDESSSLSHQAETLEQFAAVRCCTTWRKLHIFDTLERGQTSFMTTKPRARKFRIKTRGPLRSPAKAPKRQGDFGPRLSDVSACGGRCARTNVSRPGSTAPERRRPPPRLRHTFPPRRGSAHRRAFGFRQTKVSGRGRTLTRIPSPKGA